MYLYLHGVKDICVWNICMTYRNVIGDIQCASAVHEYICRSIPCMLIPTSKYTNAYIHMYTYICIVKLNMILSDIWQLISHVIYGKIWDIHEILNTMLLYVHIFNAWLIAIRNMRRPRCEVCSCMFTHLTSSTYYLATIDPTFASSTTPTKLRNGGTTCREI